MIYDIFLPAKLMVGIKIVQATPIVVTTD